MNDEVSVIKLDDNQDYVVLEKITMQNQDYLILFLEEDTRKIMFVSYDEKEKTVTEVTSKPILNNLYVQFYQRHPEYQN